MLHKKDVKIKHILCLINFFSENLAVYEIRWRNIVWYSRWGHTWQYSTAHAHCMLVTLRYKHTHTHTHTLRICNIYFFTIARMVAQRNSLLRNTNIARLVISNIPSKFSIILISSTPVTKAMISSFLKIIIFIVVTSSTNYTNYEACLHTPYIWRYYYCYCQKLTIPEVFPFQTRLLFWAQLHPYSEPIKITFCAIRFVLTRVTSQDKLRDFLWNFILRTPRKIVASLRFPFIYIRNLTNILD